MNSQHNLYIFDLSLLESESSMESSSHVMEIFSHFETQFQEDGEWIYFNQKKNRIEALYLSSSKTLLSFDKCVSIKNLHEDFLDIFLGRFTSQLKEKVNIEQKNNFSEFCQELDKSLKKGYEIVDLSRTEYWIWKQSHNEGVLIPKKLKKFLELI